MKKTVLLFSVGLFSLSLSAQTLTTCPEKDIIEQVDWACKLVAKDDSAFAQVRNKKYCEDNYLWIQEKGTAKMLVHGGNAKFEGRDMLETKDANPKEARSIFKEFDKAATEKGGWVNDYMWTKPKQKGHFKKKSFVRLCGKKNVVGSGVYLE